MVNDTLVLPLFNDATLAEVKEYMLSYKESKEYLYDDESVTTPIEAIHRALIGQHNKLNLLS